jgi:quercetin dioxygenase-like cupin family protein
VKLIDLDVSGGRPIDRFESVHSRHFGVAHIAGPGSVGVVVLGVDGIVGRHPAVGDQLFIVIDGEGWACGPDGHRIEVRAGQAVLWTAGEHHTSGTSTGMTALIVEAAALDVG